MYLNFMCVINLNKESNYESEWIFLNVFFPVRLSLSGSWLEIHLIFHLSFSPLSATNSQSELRSTILPFCLKWLFWTGALRLSVQDTTSYLADLEAKCAAKSLTSVLGLLWIDATLTFMSQALNAGSVWPMYTYEFANMASIL